MKKLNIGYVYALMCVSLWSFVPVVSRFGQAQLDNFQFLFWSNALSLLVVFLCLVVTKGLRGLKKLSGQQIAYIMFLGFLGCTFYYLCLYYGYAHGKGLEVLVLQYSWPILIIVLSVFILSERLTIMSWLAVAAGFCGILIVLTKGNLLEFRISNLSISSIVLIGAFAFALFSVLSKKFRGEPYTVTTVLFAGGVITSVISLFSFSEFALPQKQEMIPVLVNGAFINGISYIFWLKALEKIPASISAVLVFLSPVLSSIWIVLFFNEPFYMAYGIGLVLVLSAGIVCVRNK